MKRRTKRVPRSGVAVIGMSCIFPKAPNIDRFWNNILEKVDAVTDPPDGTWDPSLYYDAASTESDRVYCKKGGFLGELARFDALGNNVPPNAVGGEPDQWLALQLAREALADAGYEAVDERVRHRTAVVLGRGATFSAGTAISVQHSLVVTQTLRLIQQLHPEYSEEELEALREGLRSSLPPMDPQMVSGLVPNVVAGRISNRLDLMGPSYTMDAACASSLLAVDAAVDHLIDGECDMALAGGCHIWTPMPMLSVFCRLNALSHREQIRPFDKDADGTVLGEGLGLVVLKRLEDAERDGDRIYAVIRGVGIASDGKGVGVMAPRLEGEELAIRRAYEAAGIDPRTVGLIEAHGTGTALGDLTEVQALNRVLGTRESDLPSVALGSVKSMISHTVPAAGVAGIIKTALALYHRMLPPTINCEEPNPQFELETSRLYINTRARPWVHGGPHPRRAGVSAFGFGGVDAHLVLEEGTAEGVPEPRPNGDHRPQWDSEVCILTGASLTELKASVDQLLGFVQSAAGRARLQDVAFTLAEQFAELGREAAEVLAVVAHDLNDLETKLSRAAEKLADSGCRQIKDRSGIYYFSQPLGANGKVAFLFPGEGSQYPNMLSDLFVHFPEMIRCFDATDRSYRERGREHLPSNFVFPAPSFVAEEQSWVEAGLWDMEVAPAAVLTADEALLRLLEGLRVVPDVLVGHSSGEWAALRASGVFGDSLQERDRWIAQELLDVYRTTIERDGVPQAVLLAIGADRSWVQSLVERVGDGARIAMDNCPHQVVVAVRPEVLDAFTGMASTEGVVMERLSFDRPFHTPSFSAYSTRLRKAIDGVDFRPARIPIWSCSTASPFPEDQDGVKRVTSDQWAREVRFTETVNRLYDQEVRVFVEVGPRGNLVSFTEDVLRGRAHCAVAADLESRSGTNQLNQLVGLLAAHRISVYPPFLHKWRNSTAIDLTNPPELPADSAVPLQVQFPEMRLPQKLADRFSARSSAPADRTLMSEDRADSRLYGTLADPSPAGAVESPGGTTSISDGSMHEFLDTMEQFLGVQQRVMNAYLRGDSNGFRGSDVSRANGHRIDEAPAAGSPSEPRSEPTGSGVQGDPAEPAEQEQAVPAVETGNIGLEEFLVQIVSDRTGYPVEAISLEADLEADLGIDSIKRIEIMGTIRQRPEGAPVEIDRLTSLRTLREVAQLLRSSGR